MEQSLKGKIKRTKIFGLYSMMREFYFDNIYYKIVSPKLIIDCEFQKALGHPMNWRYPKDLNEKINWLKLYSDTSLWSELSDKYKVRQYIEEKGFSDILVPLYGSWTKASDIEFSKLPTSFVLKTNHGSGDIIIVKNKDLIDEKKIKISMEKALKRKFGYQLGEPHYLKIEPKIIAEQFLQQTDCQFSTSLIDYKIWCFDGKPAYIWACYSRSKESVYVEVRNLDWEYLPEKSIFTHYYKDGKGILPKPKNLDKMIETASVLSNGFPQVRVDLYETNGKIYFGEMTFTSNAGYNYFYTQDFLNELGDKIILPSRK